ncbi:methyl-accepting chemotaxis protein [Rhodoferax sp. GW822-FHT02A01]|uniref:methyl-accepting chemotaxis protein n=1 Tax=Rhodoferax sp. GW822-FHT02A01 TaxID=3141537 RepID=UPI00315D66BC
MSVTDQIKNLFAKKAPEAERESRLSLAMPDDGPDGDSPETIQEFPPEAPRVAAPAPTPGKPVAPNPDLVALPLLGARPIAQQLRLLGLALGASLLLLVGVTTFVLQQADKTALQLGSTGQALMQSQRLAKAATQALAGNAQAVADVSESAEAFVRTARALHDAGSAPELDAVLPLVDRAEKSAQAVLQAQKPLTQVALALPLIHTQAAKLLESAQGMASLKVQLGAPASEIAAAGQLGMLSQRIDKLSNELLVTETVTPGASGQLQKDMATFKELAQTLLNTAKDGTTHDAAESVLKQFEELSAQGAAVLGNLPVLGAAREAQRSLVTDSEPMRRALEQVQDRLASHASVGAGVIVLLVLAAVVAALAAAGLSVVQRHDSRKRQMEAEAQRRQAEQHEQEAKRVNDANQAAILRLMNELQTVAEGDLTQEATVTEDITGAIADSVNYTVEELRSLVANVQNTAAQVAQTTAEVDATSTELLAASKEQLHEIHATGQSVLEMAGRINDVSAQAQESARVARQSLLAAESGLTAVQNAIGGMNSIRDQIQDTSKRIKRLGESSQEIGEITELISDITEQTNVLALNAAIQAASAGDAGRGFAVVAEEVQRLAERSADATRQISALVKAIQTDTQDAIGAMERSTQGVVEGAKLSDNAGTALTEIDRVSRRVADLIEQISNSASREAGLANEVAENIQHIFAVTEQTGDGTRVTAGQVRELSRMAEELRQSVSRFKIV